MALILAAQRIALIAHESPDGDCLGSAIGLAHILSQIGKTCVPVCANPVPRTLGFMPGVDALQHTLDDENYDLVIALDAGELTRFGSLYTQHRAFLERVHILNIDHHISSSGCGQVNIIDPGAAATAELLVLFQQQAGLPLNQDAALCLLTGIITDTSSYQFTNTTARTMEVSAVLLRAGAIPETIVQPVYRTRPLAQARFQAMVIARAQTSCGGRLIWSQAFFFQAKDGIRDVAVTGVQTCALPIWPGMRVSYFWSATSRMALTIAASGRRMPFCTAA